MSKSQFPPTQKRPNQLEQLQLAYELGKKAAKYGLESTKYISEFAQIYYYKYKVSQPMLLSKYFSGYHSISDNLKQQKTTKQVSISLEDFDLDVTFEVQHGECGTNECASIIILDATITVFRDDSSKDIRSASDMPQTDSIEKIAALVWDNESEWVDKTLVQKEVNRESIIKHFNAAADQLTALKREISNLELAVIQNPKHLVKGIKAELLAKKAQLLKVKAVFDAAFADYQSIQ